eukprot:4863598-Prymnesium_polylepis.1
MPPWQRRPPSEASAMRFAVKDSWSPDQGWARVLRYGYAGHSKCSKSPEQYQQRRVLLGGDTGHFQ